MFEGIKQRLKTTTVETDRFDPSVLNDEVAARTEWGPLRGGGASFGTHELHRAAPARLEFRPSKWMKIFVGIFLFVGPLSMAVFGAIGLFAPPPFLRDSLVVTGAITVVFSGIGYLMHRAYEAPIVFDQGRNEYWRGRVAPSEVAHPDQLKNYARLDRIYALQIVSELVQSDDSSYHSYELNLVLDDGTRRNVIDHGDLSVLRSDAQALADFLNKPLWDTTA